MGRKRRRPKAGSRGRPREDVGAAPGGGEAGKRAGDRRPPEGGKEAEAAQKALTWVVGRLNVLEFLILFLALVVALLGGALVAWMLNSRVGISFRWLWAGTSLLLFILPGGFVYLREFRERRASPERDPQTKLKEPNG